MLESKFRILVYNIMYNSDRILMGMELTKNQEIGAVAQLGARLHGMQEVAGSSPASSI